MTDALPARRPAQAGRRAREIGMLRRLGAERRRAGDTRAAELAYRRALALAERYLPADDVTRARVRNDLGTGGFDEAAALYAQAHQTLAARLGPAHTEVGTVLHNIGGLAHAAGRPADGESAAREAVRIREATARPDDAGAAAERAALAVLLDATGRHDEAHELLHGALATLEAALGPDHDEVAVALANLAAIDARHGRLDAAERRLRRALTLKERSLGASHLELAPTVATLGHVLTRRGERTQASQLFQRALRLYGSRGLFDHPHATALRASLGRSKPHTVAPGALPQPHISAPPQVSAWERPERSEV
jgi:tetratricopeptide (TPR) repeat protein